MKQWNLFVADIKTQALNIVQILTKVGVIKPVDSKILLAIFSIDIETISSPDVIGK